MSSEEWNLGKILELSGYHWKTATLHAAVRLDVFTTLGEGAMPAQEVADRCGCDRDGMQRLLNALAAMGLIVKQGDNFANSEAAHMYLNSGSEEYIGHIISHHHHLVEGWSRLDEAVKTGSPVRTRSSHADEKQRKSFLLGMHNLARQIAPRIADKIDLKECRRLLDLGGGPGTYAIYFCISHPSLSATVADLPATRSYAEENIVAHGLSDRITFSDLDYLSDDISGKYDAVWLSHILHAEGPDACSKILEKAVAALMPGGKLLIHEFILKNSKDAPLFPALFSLNMLVGTRSGRSYSEAELVDMMVSAGVTNVRRLDYTGPNDSAILEGVV